MSEIDYREFSEDCAEAINRISHAFGNGKLEVGTQILCAMLRGLQTAREANPEFAKDSKEACVKIFAKYAQLMNSVGLEDSHVEQAKIALGLAVMAVRFANMEQIHDGGHWVSVREEAGGIAGREKADVSEKESGAVGHGE